MNRPLFLGGDPRLVGIARLVRLYQAASRVPDSRLPNVPLTLPVLDDQQLLGAAHALDTLRNWTAQLELGARRISDDPDDARSFTPRAIILDRVRFAGDLARAQQLALFG